MHFEHVSALRRTPRSRPQGAVNNACLNCMLSPRCCKEVKGDRARHELHVRAGMGNGTPTAAPNRSAAPTPGRPALMRGHPWKRRHALTPDQPVPFRAGRTGETPTRWPQPPAQPGRAQRGQRPGGIAGRRLRIPAGRSPTRTYLRWSKAIVIPRPVRHTGYEQGLVRRRAPRRAARRGRQVPGIYAYITSQDITAQAKVLISLLGHLRPGEKIIADNRGRTRLPAGPLGHLGPRPVNAGLG